MNFTTCQFNDSYFPIMDGVGMTAHNYAYWLNEKNVRSILVAPKVKKYKDNVEYHVHRYESIQIPGMQPYRIGIPMIDKNFKSKITKIKFDLLHAHCPFISGQVALKIARKQKIPLVTTFHSKYKEDFKKIINNPLFIRYMLKQIVEFYNKADLVWVPNKATGQTLIEYGYRGSYEIMPNGSDVHIPEPWQFEEFKNKGLELMGASKGEFNLLFVGQHRWEKNIQLILDSINILHRKNKKFKMIFVGEGYASNEMNQFIRHNNMLDKVKLLGLITDRDQLKCVYAASTLFVFPSIYDNSPLVMQEAAAFDIPSIVVQNSSSAEQIADGVNGFLITNDKYSLSSKIEELMLNLPTIHKVGEGARKTIYKPWEGIVNEVYNRYLDIIKYH